jgi:neopullulanase
MRNKPLSFIFSLCLLLGTNVLFSQKQPVINRIDPPSWWTGMPYNELQLMVHGRDISKLEPAFSTNDILIKEVHRTPNSNYLFIDIRINPEAKSGKYNLILKSPNGASSRFPFELLPREDISLGKQGFKSSDAIYLLMPDRFSNGDPKNDDVSEMLEPSNRQNPNGRHGGDIKGILNHLDYIADMGFTCLWINPLLENNMSAYSYHGYAITDLYRTDPRFGSNSDYRNLVDSAHKKGLKIIMDMVFNHCATKNFFIEDLPTSDWVNQWNEFTRSNYRGEVNTDPYASEFDKKKMANGWFDATMADLNQKNPFVYKYLLQNSIWWIEFAGIDGIRMDTYPYPDKLAMADWAKTILSLYPHFNIVGETWLREPSHTAYWQKTATNYDGFNSNLPSVTDFPTYFAVKDALNEKEGWIEGLSRIYYTLSQDFLYSKPQDLLIFLDNHDLTRFYTDINEDFNKFKMGIAYILTTRGIPQIYYGTEILMTGKESEGHGFIRKDFPGGWDSDSVDAFTGLGLSDRQKDAQRFIKTLLNWRKVSSAIHTGHFRHFIPENGVYVYFRYNDQETIMVVLNKNKEEIKLNSNRYSEILNSFTSAQNIMSKDKITSLEIITVPPESPLILKLIK